MWYNYNFSVGSLLDLHNTCIYVPIKFSLPIISISPMYVYVTAYWSFGVTCWEIFTGGVTPYPGVPSSAIPRMRDENMIVKVADFGFSENMYSRAYVRIVVDGGVRLPVK